MPRKPSIRRVAGQWTAVDPTYGFGKDAVGEFDSHGECAAWLTDRRPPSSPGQGGCVDFAGCWADGIAEVPRWSPERRYPDERPGPRPLAGRTCRER